MTISLANSTPLPFFNVATTFYVSPTLAPNNTTLTVTSINVYFMYIPAGTTNQSGINNPGVTMYIANTIFNVPQITTDCLQNFARCEYTSIQSSSDASVPTNFLFNTPVTLEVGQQYAFVLSYDGNETFFPWTATAGQWLTGTRNVYGGATNQLAGQYFEFVSNGDPTNTPLTATTEAQYLSFWNPLNNTQMTFDIFAARYFIDGVPVAFSNAVSTITPIYGNNVLQGWDASSNTLTFSYPTNNVEGIAFNLSTSTVQSYIGAQRVYQNTVSYPGGYANGGTFVTVATTVGNTIITANTSLPNGSAFNWNNIFPSLVGYRFIVLSDISGTNVRRVVGIANNTVIQVDEPVTFTNAIATFMVSPVATVDSTLSASPYGLIDNFLFLQGSNANSTVRFVNNTILSIGGGNGTGYSNSDILYIKGFEQVTNKVAGGYVAVANLVTNSSGGIASIYQSNLGCGFTYPANVVAVVANSTNVGNTTSNTSGGSGAAFTYTIGATLCTEMTTNIFQNCVVSNFNIDDVTPFCQISNPVGTNYNLQISALYYMTVDASTSSGYAYYVQNPPELFDVALSQINPLVSSNPICFVSRSNEFNTLYSNGAVNDQANAVAGYSNSIIVNINTQTIVDDDYVAVNVQTTPTIEFGHYVINDSDYNEYTNSGNAWSKHLTTLINFNQFAEDARIYLDVYQPINTGFAVFAKIQNSNDTESFDDEDWTQMQQVSGQGLVSSLSDQTDYVQIGFGFEPYAFEGNTFGPNSYVTFSNTIATVNNSANVTTPGGFTAAGLVSNTLVKIYNPLFANVDYLIAEVTSVANDTQITLDTVITSDVNIGGNPAFISSVTDPLSMDILAYPHQAYNNINNDNVVRYYNTSFIKYDGYNNLAIKVVFLSSAFSYIPQLNNISVLGVTA
jgi:hypothetical protein